MIIWQSVSAFELIDIPNIRLELSYQNFFFRLRQ